MLEANDNEVKDDNLATTLDNVRNQKSFVIIEGTEKLSRIMAEPLEKRSVFLYSTQRKPVKNNKILLA